MSVVITILLSLVGLIALFFALALFMKKEYTIQREIVISKPKYVVFDYVKYLKNQDYFNKWVMIDPSMKKEYRGTDGTVGFVYAWNSKNKQAGEGEQEIVKLVDGERVDVEVRFERPFKSIAKTPIKTEAFTENQTKVIWTMHGNSN